MRHEKHELYEAYQSIPLYTSEQLDAMDEDTLGEYLDLLEARERFVLSNKLLTFRPDPWTFDLCRKMEGETVGSIIASNRSGKSYSVTWLLACHLTGIYPEDYEGLRYEDAIDAWIMSPTAENYVQAGGLQEYLLGKMGEMGTGWIPADCIVKVELGLGTKGFFKKVYVKHVNGGVSTLEYKSYSQGQSVLMGGSVDLVVVDEEPKDEKIVPQCATRIMQANSKKGRLLLCFTPELGMTEVVRECFEGKWAKGCVRITVWDVSFITPEKIEEMKKTYPERQHQMRLYGIPSIGRGAVFPQSEAEVKYYTADIEIQPHWRVAAAFDFGYLPDPHVCLFGALDPDNGIYYIFKELYETEKTPAEIAGWIKRFAPSIPVIYPADGNKKHGTADGLTLVDMFKQEGIDMKERVDYGKAGLRETGHTLMRTLFRQGQLFIGDNCPNWFREFRVYQYDDTGKTDKCQD
ncbi:MAG: terminase large subunit domain-containing protein, partial [Mycoplasma sp.]